MSSNFIGELNDTGDSALIKTVSSYFEEIGTLLKCSLTEDDLSKKLNSISRQLKTISNADDIEKSSKMYVKKLQSEVVSSNAIKKEYLAEKKANNVAIEIINSRINDNQTSKKGRYFKREYLEKNASFIKNLKKNGVTNQEICDYLNKQLSKELSENNLKQFCVPNILFLFQ